MFEWPFRQSIECWSAVRRFHASPAHTRQIVFYAEDAESWPHLGPVVEHLTQSMGRHVCYVTSSRRDPMLHAPHPLVRSFCVGESSARTSWFMSLQANLCVMTMPDLQTFHLKRSRRHPVHYAYVFHSMVSTHMIYRPAAFDAFDTILCAGPHHVREIRATEAANHLPAKHLIEHGYGRLDTLLRNRQARGPSPRPDTARPVHVLIAPSWGPHGLLETCGEACVRALLNAGFQVTVRPHPMTRRKWPGCIATLEKAFRGHPHLVLENDVAGHASLETADVMISDWSGAALEFAFAFQRPVLFVDLPRKVNNPDYERIGCLPLEVSIRDRIGRVLPSENLAHLPDAVHSLCAQAPAWRERIAQVRAESIYNVGESARVAAEQLAAIANRCAVQPGDAHALCRAAG